MMKKVISIILLVGGLLCNERVLMFLSPDGIFEPVNILVMRILSVTLILFSLLVWRCGIKYSLVFGAYCSAMLIFADLLLKEKPPGLPILEDGTPYRTKADLDIKTKMQGEEISIKTDKSGLRDTVGEGEKIAVTGDSFTFGLWASNNSKTFVNVLDSLSDYDVINFGVCGYGMKEIELQLDEIKKYSPKYVIVMFYNGNDFRDTYMGLDRYNIENGVAVFKNQKKKKFTFKSNIYSRLMSMYPLKGDNINSITDYPDNRFLGWSKTEQDMDYQCAVDDTLNTLSRISSKANIILVSIPTREQVLSCRMQGNGYDIKYPQEFLRLFAQKNNVPYLDLLPMFREYKRKYNKDLYLHYDGHLNDRGHRTVGVLLAEFLEKL